MSSTEQLIGEAVRLIALAIFPEWDTHVPDTIKRDPLAMRHRAEIRAAARGRDLCDLTSCREIAEEDGWCFTHAPDEAAILRACNGDTVPLTPIERTEAVRRMNAAGVPAVEVARMLNVTKRTVERHVAKTRRAAA